MRVRVEEERVRKREEKRVRTDSNMKAKTQENVAEREFLAQVKDILLCIMSIIIKTTYKASVREQACV